MDGQEVARTTVGRTVSGAFSASETFDVGVDLARRYRLITSIGGVWVEMKQATK